MAQDHKAVSSKAARFHSRNHGASKVRPGAPPVLSSPVFPWFTHPLVLVVWTAACCTAVLFAWLAVSNLLTYRALRTPSLLVYIAFGVCGSLLALVVGLSVVPMTPLAKSHVFRLMWTFGLANIAFWAWSVVRFIGVRAIAVRWLRNGLLLLAVLPLVDFVVVTMTGWSALYVLEPQDTRSIILSAVGAPFSHRPAADLFALAAIVLILATSVSLLALVLRHRREEWLLSLGIVITGACAVAEASLAGTNSAYNLPLLFVANIIEACRITWASHHGLFLGVMEVRNRQAQQAALLTHQLEQIKLAARMTRLGEDTAQLSHDMRNPLTTVLGAIDLATWELTAEPPQPSKALELLRMSRDALDHVLELVRRITRQARDEADEPSRPIDARRLIEDAISLCHHRIGELDVSVECDDDARILGRRTDLVQVLVNLVSNACDALRDHESVRGGWIRVSAKRSRKRVQLFVADAGPRPADAILDRMFTHRFSTHLDDDGTGLGLTICARIVEQHMGRIFVDRRQPTTTFVVDLPAAPAAPETKHQGPRRATEPMAMPR